MSSELPAERGANCPDDVERLLRSLHVKTLSPARADENYERTRRFYLAEGFTPLEEFPDLWDERNPVPADGEESLGR